MFFDPARALRLADPAGEHAGVVLVTRSCGGARVPRQESP